VAPGGVVDGFGDVNGSPSNRVEGSGPAPTPTATPTGDPTATPTPTETSPATTVTEFTADSDETGQYTDEAIFEARLTDESGNTLTGETLAFDVTGAAGTQVFETRTNDSGVGRVTVLMDGAPGSYAVAARFTGNDAFAPSADVSSFVLEREDSALSLALQGQGAQRRLLARLSDGDSNDPIAGATVVFFADGQQIGEGQTDNGGRVNFSLPARYRGGHHEYEARFDGDPYFLGSTSTTTS
jgi:hypothetical protein